MTAPELTGQLIAIFGFGIVITGLVFLGLLRAREHERRLARGRGRTPANRPHRLESVDEGHARLR